MTVGRILGQLGALCAVLVGLLFVTGCQTDFSEFADPNGRTAPVGGTAGTNETASPSGVDTALRLGANHPKGPFEWMSQLGPGLVFALMDGLWEWYREERYRPAPGLRQRAGPSS